MADTISAYSKTAASNTTLQSISCAEGMAPSDVNNWMRAIMQDLAELYDGTQSLATLKTTTALSAADGSTSVPSVQFTSDTNTGLYWPGADTVGVVAGGTEQFRFGSNPIPGGSKNMLINGNMLIDQRGSTADMGGTNGNTYGGPDRFCVHVQSSPQGRGTVTQDTTVLAGSGQSKSYKFDCTTAESAVASGEEIAIQYRFEGQDIQHWMYGQTNAVTLTLSFDFRSPKSGTHCVAFYAMDDNENYIAEFTVASADTFEHFEITVALPTSGTDIVADNTEGFRITWPLVCGSAFQASADTWQNSEAYATSNQQNLLDNTANNIYLSGVQLEVGSVATDFAHEDIGTTTAKCQRYFNRIAAGDTDVISTVHANTADSYWYGAVHLPVEMRAIPTESANNDTHFSILNAGASTACSNISLAGRTSPKTVSFEITTGARTAGHGGTFMTNNAASTLDLSAEL